MKKQIALSVLTLFSALLTGNIRSANATATPDNAPSGIELLSEKLQVSWKQEKAEWHINKIVADGKQLMIPSGYYNIIYHKGAPAAGRVTRDIEGKDHTFYPSEAIKLEDGSIQFSRSLEVADIKAIWKIDPDYPTDIRVSYTLTARQNGCFSIANPTIATIEKENLSWAMIPGNWYGTEVESNYNMVTSYSQGIPNVPYLATEKNSGTLCPLITTKNNITLAVIPDPGTSTDPWDYDKSTRSDYTTGMSVMNRHSEYTPIVYSPVLGQKGSKLKAGESITYNFRYSIQAANWFPVFSHAVNDIYQLPDMLDIQTYKLSLSERIRLMQKFLRNETKSQWRTWDVRGYKVGATGAKNADAGTMCMMAYAGEDSVMQERMTYVRNFKLAQQEMKPGFFQGAALGEYAYSDIVESEVGNWIEPLFTTYYTMMDVGNMLLFQPEDKELKERLRMGADKLLQWQHADGSWDVAYDRFSEKLAFPDLTDYRATWYGLLIAHRILGNDNYLKAAIKGADWLLENGVKKGLYLGVCGDARNVWDFATAQTAQAYLELYDITKNEAYKDAAIEAARVYTTSIFTHPVASNKTKAINGQELKDWEMSQAGLGVEHIRGTASSGPILLTSYAGLFTRIYEHTHEPIFLTMARVAGRGRDFFVEKETGVALYYWSNKEDLKTGASKFPWHAFWQVGWITDYLMSEAHLRSNGQIAFPAGFMTPKVGPHITYGFAPGTIYGRKARMILPEDMILSSNPYTEYITAVSDDNKNLYLIALNQSPTVQQASFTINPEKSKTLIQKRWTGEKMLQGKKAKSNRSKGSLECEIEPWGISVIALDLK